MRRVKIGPTRTLAPAAEEWADRPKACYTPDRRFTLGALMISRKLLSPALVAVGAIVAVAACGQMMIEPTLDLAAKPRTIDGLGQKATLTLTAVDSTNKPGTGKVTVTSSAGSLKDGEDVVLSGGEGTVDFTCTAATDVGCTGKVTLTASWTTNGKKVTAETSVTVIAALDAGSDAGAIDAGVDAGMVDGGTPGFAISSDKNKVFKLIGDSARVTVTVTQGTTPVANQMVTFSTTLGAIGATTGVPTQATYSTSTDSNGVAVAKFVETGTAGTATISANSGAQHAETNIEILAVKDITFVAGTCGTTTPCTTMGSRGSGYNETNTLAFKVTDSNSNPVPDVSVTFAIAGPTLPDGGVAPGNAPVGVTVMSGAVKTDAMGVAKGVISSGLGIGQFSVKAIVVAGVLETVSTPLVIRASRPSNNGLTIQCEKVNWAAYLTPNPPLQLTINCTISVNDRAGSAVVNPTTVKLLSEVGEVPSTVMTSGGVAPFTVTIKSPFPPQDVDPLLAAPSQYPQPRMTVEPSYMSGALTVNPRDGLVTVVAALTGEEWFDDTNGNGTWDTGEQFIDQGEAYVDRNDNDVRDQGEFSSDDSPSDGQYNAPNGRWDSTTTIWTTTRLLLTDKVDLSHSTVAPCSRFQPTTFAAPSNSSAQVRFLLCDRNLNQLESGTSFSTTQIGPRGSQMLLSGLPLLDGFGFGLEQNVKLNATGTGPCSPTTPICSFFTRFNSWGDCGAGAIVITGGSGPNVPPAAATSMQINLTVTTRNVSSVMSINGTIEGG